MKLLILRGLPASGKSTYGTEFLKNNPSYRRINRDSYRHMLDSYSYSAETEKLVTALEKSTMRECVRSGYDIILDKCNLNDRYLKEDISYVEKCVAELRQGETVEVEIKEFPVYLSQAIERDAARDFSIGKEAIKRMWRTYETTLRDMIERAKPKNPDNDRADLPVCILCDIDGSLAKANKRNIFDESKVHTDDLIKPVADILLSYGVVRNLSTVATKIFVVSGRKDSCKEQTEQWLKKHDIPYDAIYMRRAEDSRDDTLVKEEIYDENIRGRYRVLFVIDDRKKVVQKWVNLGLFVLDVSQDPYAENNF